MMSVGIITRADRQTVILPGKDRFIVGKGVWLLTSMVSNIKPPDSAARTAGLLLIVTAVVTVVAVVGRVAADADQDTFEHSMTYIAVNSGLYGLGGAARAVSGVTLIAAACFLLRTWIVRERLGTPLVPALFVVSGLFTVASGTCAVVLALFAPDVSATSILTPPDQWLEPVAYVRWLTGKIGFAIAGLALIVAARYQWMAGGALRYMALVSAIVGLAMQFIWIDSATIVHPIIGVAFFLWLLAIGFMLATGRIERNFIALSAREHPVK